MNNQTVLILDFGGQFKELIARRVRECGVYSLILPGSVPLSRIREIAPIGIILTGGPDSVYRDDAPHCDPALFEMGIPVLGFCYGHQLMCYTLGGTVSPCEVSEYGQTEVEFDSSFVLFRGLTRQKMLMSHTDQVTALPEGFRVVAHTANCPYAATANEEKRLYSFQFHPEVELSEGGTELIRRYLYDICGAVGDYSMDDFIRTQIEEIRAKVGEDQVLLGLSGGVDSSVCAALLSEAIPNQLICIFVDHGFMRKNEGDEVEEAFKDKGIKFVRVNAAKKFLSALEGVTDPETKRKTIGRLFVECFQEEAEKFTKSGRVYLAQGTIYPDVVESGKNGSAAIKSHHNVGGLPKDMNFVGLVEPLRNLFKDEVREVGRKLGLSPALVNRQPFPGPGLAIRIIGEITWDKLETLRDADAIWREEIERAGVKASQYFAVLTNIRTVGVMGDSRTYDYTLGLRAIKTSDFMTAEYVHVPYEVLDRVSARIINEVKGINRICYDVTGKPPATVEWE